jgi:hypothetical protein
MNKSEREKSRREAWLLTRARGRTRFVFVAGVAWGCFYALAMILFRLFVDHKPLDVDSVLFCIAVAALAGAAAAFWTWQMNEKKFGPFAADDRRD